MPEAAKLQEKDMPEYKLAALFEESAKQYCGDGTALPIQGDLRIHLTMDRSPKYLMENLGLNGVVHRLFQFASMADRNMHGLVGNKLDNDKPVIVAAYSKEPPDYPMDKPHRVFIDVDLSFVQDHLDLITSTWRASYPETPRNLDDILNNLLFQTSALMTGIDKMETKDLAIDLSKFKSVAVKKETALSLNQTGLAPQ